MRILIVDDDPDLVLTLKEYFESRGDNVTTAANGEQGWALFSKTPEKFDAILTDNRMPIMSGVELIKKIRQNGFAVPIVLLSGTAELERDEYIDNEVLELLSKPAKLSTLDAIFFQLESNLTHPQEFELVGENHDKNTHYRRR